jgi:WD40 repeat protein
VAFAPDGKQALTGGGDGKVILWDVATGKPVKVLEGHTKVSGVAFAPDGRTAASVGPDRELRVWDLTTFKPRLHSGTSAFQAVAFAPDGRRLLTGDAGDADNLDGAVRLWTVGELTEIYCLKGHRGAVHAVTFTPDGRRAVSAGADRSVRLWELPE